MSEDQPAEIKMYGYCLAWRRKPKDRQQDPKTMPKWQIEQCDQYRNLPAHYASLEEALDRAEHMRAKGVDVRVVALVAESTDTAEDFDRNRVHG
jgi:hypothetical protein